jgi:predicted AAA+ superfamily ATPase
MHGYIDRMAEGVLAKALARSPVVAILGPRQCGKSTLAARFLEGIDSVYLDLQARPDLAKLAEPELFLEQHRHHLVCLDEIQRLPSFFSILRSEIDRNRRPGRFLILGSASRDLIRQSTESLAGRIAYLDLAPFVFPEVATKVGVETLWLRGGFPDSLLAHDDEASADWRQDFTRTFLERDIPALGFAIPIPVMDRLWRLLAHYHGQTMNYSKLAEAVDLSIPTLKKYLALLEQTYMIRQLPPYTANLKKRLVKSPKLYIRDSGILHSLLDIVSYDDLLSRPVTGASWEGFALETLVACKPRWRASFLRTSNGAEVDLVLEKGNERHVYEFKASKAPKPSRGFFELVRDLRPTSATVVAPVDEVYEIGHGATVANLQAVTM